MRKLVRFFDKLEDKIRGRLSRYPIIYSIIGGTGIVLFWRGVWITADEIAANLAPEYVWLDGPVSMVASIIILLATGLFVSFFVSDQVILSGIKQEKKMVEKTENEVRQEASVLTEIKHEMHHIEEELKTMEDKLSK